MEDWGKLEVVEDVIGPGKRAKMMIERGKRYILRGTDIKVGRNFFFPIAKHDDQLSGLNALGGICVSHHHFDVKQPDENVREKKGPLSYACFALSLFVTLPTHRLPRTRLLLLC